MKTTNLALFMRLAVEGATRIIQAEAANYARIEKMHYDGVKDDLVTSADLKAQEYYAKEIEACFPGVALVGEENGKGHENTLAERFTCDPVDGTKAYGRNQSTGVGTMFAHANGDEVDAVCVGDINTGEIYQFAPGHEPTRTRFGHTSLLPTEWTAPLNKKYALLNHPTDDFPLAIGGMIRQKYGGIFKDMEVTSGSIGIAAARVWKGEVAVLILHPSYETPWDSTPIIGMNRKLGIVHIKVNHQTGASEMYEPKAPTAVTKKDFTEIMVHKTYAEEVLEWLNDHVVTRWVEK